MRDKIRILISDKHSLLRAGLLSLFNNHPNIEVIGESVDENDTINKAITLKPHLLLTEILTTKENNTKTISYIKKRIPELKVLVLTMHGSEKYIHAALDAGADGCVLKKDDYQELVKAITNIINGKMYLSSSICNGTIFEYLNINEKHNDNLTNREREIIKLIASGYRNKDIAEFLSISNKTVQKHRFNLMGKLNLHNISGITTYAINNELSYIKGK